MKTTVDSMAVSTFHKMTAEQKREHDNNFDNIEAPPGPYKLQPENQG